MKPKTNRDGFQLVLAHFIRQNGGRTYRAKKLMADALGVSRQSVDNYEDTGIPSKYLKKVRELTGLKPEEILPESYG